MFYRHEIEQMNLKQNVYIILSGIAKFVALHYFFNFISPFYGEGQFHTPFLRRTMLPCYIVEERMTSPQIITCTTKIGSK